MKNIAIVTGGYSSESVVSLKSAETVCSSIDQKKYHANLVLITKEKWVVQLKDKMIDIDKNDFSFQLNEQKIRFNFAYIVIHGTPGENGLLQGYFELLGIPYSGCGVLASSLADNKYYCSNYLRGFGVKTMKSIFLRKGEEIPFEKIIAELGFPVFVKPNRGGSSFGASIASTMLELQSSISMAFDEGEEIIVNRFANGKEVTCGCYKTKDKQVVFPITEIVPKNAFFDFESKYTYGGAEEITPAQISKELTNEIQLLTSRIYDWIGAKGIIRVDYIISHKDEVQFLEVNTIPGMTTTSLIPHQIHSAGLSFQEILTEIIESI